ncbi:MAG TPA: hypothetical protein VG755_23435 [Nannocystaceae bacterium]|nr:hypothetical protein [Nannocystaceae bacterium]
MNDSHPRHRVASLGPCSIEQCDCGVLHITVGAITMRLQHETARALSIALDRALVVCEEPQLLAGSFALGD